MPAAKHRPMACVIHWQKSEIAAVKCEGRYQCGGTFCWAYVLPAQQHEGDAGNCPEQHQSAAIHAQKISTADIASKQGIKCQCRREYMKHHAGNLARIHCEAPTQIQADPGNRQNRDHIVDENIYEFLHSIASFNEMRKTAAIITIGR